MEHRLKTWPAEHDDVGHGLKTFEVRSNTDRSFAVGDILLLQRWDPAATYLASEDPGRYVDEHGCYCDYNSGDGAHTHCMRVTYILHGGRFGVPAGICVMGIVPDESASADTGGGS